MNKQQYELERDQRVSEIKDVFKSLGLSVLAHEVRDVFSKKENKGKRKSVDSDKPESDLDYDPTSDNDKQSNSDDDNDLINEVNPQVRCIHRPPRCFFQYLVIYLFNLVFIFLTYNIGR